MYFVNLHIEDMQKEYRDFLHRLNYFWCSHVSADLKYLRAVRYFYPAILKNENERLQGLAEDNEMLLKELKHMER